MKNMKPLSLYKEKLEERFRVSRRKQSKISHDKKVDFWKGPQKEDGEDSLVKNLRRFRSAKKQPRQKRRRTFDPKSGFVTLVHESNPTFRTILIDYDFLPKVRAHMKKPGVRSNPSHPNVQTLYYLLQVMPDQAIKFFLEDKILSEDGNRRNEPFEVHYTGWLGGYYTCGKYYVNFQVSRELEDGSFKIPKSLAEKLYEACEHDPLAQSRLREFGLFQTDISITVGGTTAESEVTGAEELGDPYHRFAVSRRNREDKNATILRKRDLRKNKKNTRKKRHYSWKLGGKVDRKTSNGEPVDTDKRRKTSKSSKSPLPPEELRIYSAFSFFKACKYVHSGRAKAQGFTTVNPIAQEPIQIMLRYVQSRTDRGLCIELRDIVSLTHPVVNYRLSKWEERKGRKIPSVPDLLRGRFIVEGNGDSEPVRVIEGDNRIYVSRNYHGDPSRYVTTQNELLSATRRVLRGEMDVGDFNVLDPRAQAILEYAQEVRTFAKGCIKPKDIASVNVPELERRLKQRGLFDYAPQFQYKNK